MKAKTIKDLFAEQIKDLYHAEKLLLKTLPGIAAKIHTQHLKQDIETHVEHVQKQIETLEKISRILDVKPTGKKSAAMEVFIEEAKKLRDTVRDQGVLEAGLTTALRKAAYYEEAGMETLRELASSLGNQQIIKILSIESQPEKEKSQPFAGEGRKEASIKAISHG